DFWGDARALLDWGFAEREKAGPVGTLVNPIPPPPKPTPRAIPTKQAATVQTPPGGAFAWWKLGLPTGVGVVVLAGLTVGLLRRRRPSPAGPPPEDAPRPAAADTIDRADVDTADVDRVDTDGTTAAEPKPKRRKWTVRLPSRSGPGAENGDTD